MKKFTPLFSEDSKGNIKQWTITAIDCDDGTAQIVTEHGQLDGKIVTRTKNITVGKNIGKSNETNPYEQAILEAQSSWTKKRDQEDYFESVKEAQGHESKLPMLAQPYDKRKHYIVFPAFVQPKLDGVRCLSFCDKNNKIKLLSRKVKDYTSIVGRNEFIINSLTKLMSPGDVLDGELYVHGWSLQRINSAVKKYRDDTLLLQYWVYDFPSIADTFESRINRLKEVFGNTRHPQIVLTETEPIDSEQTMVEYHKRFVNRGFEGAIIRNSSGLYSWGNRSNDLQKYKHFKDDEFKIVGSYSEQQQTNGKEYTCIVFICETDDGTTFHCRPKGTLEDRQQAWGNREKFIGKYLTVRYFTLTDSDQGSGRGVPQFPVGITVRDYE